MNRTRSDIVIIGGGIIGLSLALELRRDGASVHVLERGEPGREASYAGAGMLAARDPDTPVVLRELACAAAAMYPEWIAELEEQSGVQVDLRREGTLYLSEAAKEGLGDALSSDEAKQLEPGLEVGTRKVYFTDEASVDPRTLLAATVTAAKRRGVVISHEHEVTGIETAAGRVTAVKTANGQRIEAGAVVNCAGAWAGEVSGMKIPTHPVKGEMTSVVPAHSGTQGLKHVVRGDAAYMVPRSDGRILIGATVEDAGFDKRVDAETILRLRKEAEKLYPRIGEMRIHESWAGLRPGSPDKLPIMGKLAVEGGFAATGHYRNGILLAPVTAKVMARMMAGEETGFRLEAFDPARFARQRP